MIMKLVGKTKVNQGTSKKDNKPYKMQDVHFMGTRLGVEGSAVANVTLNLLEDEDKLPELLIDSIYIVDLSDKGYLRSLELLENFAPSASTQQPRNLKLNVNADK